MDFIVPTLYFIIGLAILSYSGQKAVKNAEKVAVNLGIPAIVVGAFIVGVGTDIPEIANSIVSSMLGHGDINVGDSFGSCLLQITVVLGVAVLMTKNWSFRRRNVMVLGAGALIALMSALLATADGNITRLDAVMLILIFAAIFFVTYGSLSFKEYTVGKRDTKAAIKALAKTTLYFIGVFAGSFLVVTSVISLSMYLGIPEYIISFFGAAVGTSVPELVISVIALRRERYGIAIGNIIGSNIVNPTLALGLGPLISPIAVSAALAINTGVYTLVASTIILSLIIIRRKIDRVTAVIAVLLYLLSYATLLV